MSGRFEKLFSLPENLYAIGAPVVIAQGFLLKDHEKEVLLAQLKLKNISRQVISAVKLALVPVDEEGNALADKMTYAYQHLAAARDDFFGQKSAVIVSAAEATGFKACVTEVVFADETKWTADADAEWNPLPMQQDLLSLLQGDVEMVKQYQMEYTPDAKFQPVIDRDLWCCACGAINAREEANCHVCGCALDELSKVDFRVLNAKKLARVEGSEEPVPEFNGLIPDDYEEADEGKKGKKKDKKAKKEKLSKEEKKAAKKAAKEEKKANKKKKGGKVVAILLVLILLCAGGYFGYGYYTRESAYRTATEQMQSGNYAAALENFQKLGDYKDTADKIKNTKYLQAVDLVGKKFFEEAISLFRSLGDYQDCDVQIQKAQYQLAEMLAENGNYKEAIDLFHQLGETEDVKTQLATIYKQAVTFVKEDKLEAAIEIFTALGDYQKSPGLLLCTLVAQKMSASMSSVTMTDLSSMPKDYPYAKKLLAYYNNYKSLAAYAGTFTCTQQTSNIEKGAKKENHTLVSDFQLSGGKLLWVFSDEAEKPNKNRSQDFKPIDNYYFFSANRTVSKNHILDRYRANNKTIATATLTFADGKITYQATMNLTGPDKQTETLVFSPAKAETETTTTAGTTTTTAGTTTAAADVTTTPAG